MIRAIVVAASVVLVATLLACPPQNLPRPIPPPPPPGSGYDPQPEHHVDAGPGSGSGSATAGGANGAKCTAGADCKSGVCEGEGCGPGQGVCASRQRACTLDIRQYCGCDGSTFDASGSCPERRFSHRGACKAAGGGSAAGALPAGSACLLGTECDSGVCEGKGCAADAPGVCAAKSRGCTKDRRAYCGCDGKTFYGSGTCPGQRYQSSGACVAAP